MNSKIAEDLDYLRDVAEAGTHAPSLSGRFATLWYGLLALALMGHWMIAAGLFPGVGLAWVSAIWISFLVLGYIGSYLIGRSLKNYPGHSAANNKVDRYTWRIAGFGLVAYVSAIAIGVLVRDDMSPALFDTIMPAAFLSYAVCYSGTAAFTRGFSKWLPIIASLGAMAVAITLIGLPEIYLASAIGVVAIWSLGGVRQLREEPDPVV